MHELSVTESILNIATRHARQSNARRVMHVHLVIGQLSSIIDESVQFYWDIVSQGTICESAQLHFQRLDARFQCQDCDQEFALSGDVTPCPHCGSIRLDVLSGEEFYLESIEIEK